MIFTEEVEEKLVNKAKTNANAFAELYRRYVKKIYNFFYYHTFNISESEDLTSVVFEKALTHLSNLKPATNFSAWIFRITHNSLVDFYRQHSKVKNYKNIEEIDLCDEINLEKDLEKREEILILMKQLNKVRSFYKEVLILKYQQELSNREISNVIGKSEGAVKQILRRALKELQKKMSELGD